MGFLKTNVALEITRLYREFSFVCFIYEGRILTIRYEDLAQDPLALTTILYRFVGLDLLQEIKSYVRTITSSDMFRNNGKITGTSFLWLCLKYITESKNEYCQIVSRFP